MLVLLTQKTGIGFILRLTVSSGKIYLFYCSTHRSQSDLRRTCYSQMDSLALLRTPVGHMTLVDSLVKCIRVVDHQSVLIDTGRQVYQVRGNRPSGFGLVYVGVIFEPGEGHVDGTFCHAGHRELLSDADRVFEDTDALQHTTNKNKTNMKFKNGPDRRPIYYSRNPLFSSNRKPITSCDVLIGLRFAAYRDAYALLLTFSPE